jgi:hypothetical protein
VTRDDAPGESRFACVTGERAVDGEALVALDGEAHRASANASTRSCRLDKERSRTVNRGGDNFRDLQGRRSGRWQPHAQPGGMTGELQVTRQVGQLLNLGWEYRRLRDVLLATADAVARFGEESAFPRA